jgi:hypothetical protein
MVVAGIAAGITSLFQAAISETMTYRDAHGASPAGVRIFFDVANDADTVKIAFLARGARRTRQADGAARRRPVTADGRRLMPPDRQTLIGG